MFKKIFALTFTSFYIFIISAEKASAENVLNPYNTSLKLMLADNSNIKNKTHHIKKTNTSKNKNNLKPTFPVYIPPLRGAPLNRIGGGTRGTYENIKILSLSPDHTGLTIKNQPKLYFYLPTSTNNSIEFILINENMEEPLIETNLSVKNKGLQVIDISKFNVQLKEENTYQWYVSLKQNTEQPSLDIVSGGLIKYVKAPSELTKNMSKKTSELTSFDYAKAGIWYETVSSIIEESTSGNNKENINSQLSSLLSQAGINQNILK